MNGLRTRLEMDSAVQKVHDKISHAGDFAAGIGALVLGALYLILRAFGVVA